MKLMYFDTFDKYKRQSMYVIFLQCTYCVQKSLTVSCMLLCECGDRVKVDQSSFSADLHAVMLRHTARSVVLSVVSSGYRIRFTGPSLLLETPRENTISPGPQKVQGMREQISLMLQKNAIMEVPQDSIKSFPCMQSVRRVTSSNIFKTTERSHLYTSLSIAHYSSVLSTVEKGDYVFKINLQDAYFHVIIHPDKVYQLRVLPFGLNTAPQVFTCLGYTVIAYLRLQGISVILYLNDWLIHRPDHPALLCHQSQLLKTLDLVGLNFKNEGKSERDQFRISSFKLIQWPSFLTSGIPI